MSDADWEDAAADDPTLVEHLERNRAKAGELLAEKGLTIDQATNILISRIAESGIVPDILLTPDHEHDGWFQAQVQEALDDPRQLIPGEDVDALFTQKRAALRARIAGSQN